MPVLSQTIGPELIRVLGLPKTTKSVEIRLNVDCMVEVTCTYLPEGPLDELPSTLAVAIKKMGG